jgi:predicted DNA-binding protein (UPF0251 family)
VKRFIPEGITAGPEIVISLEEYEVIRLVDYEGMDQSGAAQIMNVSRQTVGRILKLARMKLANAVVEGHRFKVAGGCYKFRSQGRGRHGRRRGCCDTGQKTDKQLR